MRFRRGQPRSTLAADALAEEDPLFTLGLTWVRRASRPAGGLLLYQLTTLRPATISGAAAGAHGKVTFEADAVAASALPIPFLYTGYGRLTRYTFLRTT